MQIVIVYFNLKRALKTRTLKEILTQNCGITGSDIKNIDCFDNVMEIWVNVKVYKQLVSGLERFGVKELKDYSPIEAGGKFWKDAARRLKERMARKAKLVNVSKVVPQIAKRICATANRDLSDLIKELKGMKISGIKEDETKSLKKGPEVAKVVSSVRQNFPSTQKKEKLTLRKLRNKTKTLKRVILTKTSREVTDQNQGLKEAGSKESKEKENLLSDKI